MVRDESKEAVGPPEPAAGSREREAPARPAPAAGSTTPAGVGRSLIGGGLETSRTRLVGAQPSSVRKLGLTSGPRRRNCSGAAAVVLAPLSGRWDRPRASGRG
eukprot:scaffold591_cov372-Prasinococcus_capsulatus_cf.AAC.11